MALRDSYSRDDSFWSRYGSKTITIAVTVGLLAILALSAAGSCATLVKNTEVGIIVNNITGKISLLENGGMVLHLPFGLSSVYKIDKSQRVLSLTRAHRSKENRAGASLHNAHQPRSRAIDSHSKTRPD